MEQSETQADDNSNLSDDEQKERYVQEISSLRNKNKELKSLLVASVGSDLESKIEQLVTDK
eukprot:Pgem_evm1s13611